MIFMGISSTTLAAFSRRRCELIRSDRTSLTLLKIGAPTISNDDKIGSQEINIAAETSYLDIRFFCHYAVVSIIR